MCLAVYLSSNAELPTIEWNENNPSFYSIKVQDGNVVRKQFSKKYTYYLGSHESCSCGFIHDNYTIDNQDFENVKDIRMREQSKKCLIEYLEGAIEKTDELELYVCWEGEQGDKSVKSILTTLEGIFEAKWDFDTKEFYKITRR